MCVKYGVGKFVFSSSATVYGDQPSPLKEDMVLKNTTNPYGETKAMSERILTDTFNEKQWICRESFKVFQPSRSTWEWTDWGRF